MEKRDGFAIALAWPETYCKQPGAWYDGLTHFLKISKNKFYKVGHAALVLVDSFGNCYYYDFGRYHTPFGFGRVRSAATDTELTIDKKAEIKNNCIENFQNLVQVFSENHHFHGEGTLHASYIAINFQKANNFAKKLLEINPHQYGPFILNGTNCSRFVKKIINKGNPNLFRKLLLNIQPSITPSPIFNVWSLKNKTKIQKQKNQTELKFHPHVLPEPNIKPEGKTFWYAGEGAGSFFTFKEIEPKIFQVEKRSANLELESTGKFIAKNKIHLEEIESLHFPSHSSTITIKNGKLHKLYKI